MRFHFEYFDLICGFTMLAQLDCEVLIGRIQNFLKFISDYYGEDWVPKIWVPKGNTRTKIRVWVGLGWVCV